MPAPTLLSEGVTIRQATEADAASLLRLHQESFTQQWDMNTWRRRFGQNPLGALQCVGAFTPSNRCLAAFYGVPLACLYQGEPGLVQRLGDVSVHPALRQGMAGATLLVKTGKAFFRAFSNRTQRAAFGLPVPALVRLLVRHCRFEALTDVLFLVRDCNIEAPAQALPTSVDHTLARDADTLLQQWQLEAPNGITRDRAYLRWRYEDDPQHDYAIVTTRSTTGTLRGIAILRTAPLQDNALAIMDWLVPLGDEQAEGSLLAATASYARNHGSEALATTFATLSPQFARFQFRHGFRVMPSPLRVIFRPATSDITHRYLSENWHFSPGDVDHM